MQAALDVDRLQRELEAIFGPRRVSLRPVDLEVYARDMWPRLLLAYRDGLAPAQRPHAIVWPEHVREVRRWSSWRASSASRSCRTAAGPACAAVPCRCT